MGLLDLLTVFDWISPITETIKDVTCEEGTRSFIVDRGDIASVNHLLHPVSSDLAFGSGDAIVTVKGSELWDALYILDRNGIQHRGV
jgi:hypothetical protein